MQPIKPPAKVRVFVYGTLKRGRELHQNIERLGGRFLRADVVAGFDLYNLGWYSGIVRGKGNVAGEVFEFDNPVTALDGLDRVEGAPYLYRRETIQLVDGPVETYIYNRPVANKGLVATGEW